MKVGEKIRIKHFATTYNGMIGEVIDKDGAYHTVKLESGMYLHDVYDYEMEVIDDHP